MQKSSISRTVSIKPRLACVITSLGGGGAEKVFTQVVKGLSESYEIYVITMAPGGVYEAEVKDMEHVQWSCMDKDATGSFQAMLNLRKVLKKFNPIAVLSFLEYANILTCLALTGSRIPHVSSERTNYMLYLTQGWKDTLTKMLLRLVFVRAKRIIAVSKVQASGLHKDLGAPKKKIRVIPNGVNQEKISSLASQAGDLQLPWPCDQNCILAVGRLSWEKNYPLMIQAFAEVHKKFPQARLLILGKGELEASLNAEIQNLNLQDFVCLGGFTSNPYPYMKQAGVFCLSSVLEGMPNALIEAFYLNGHCVSTDCETGPSEIITHEHNGLLVPVNHTEALAMALMRMLTDQNFRPRMAQQAALDSVKFSSRNMIAAFSQVIEESCRD